MRKIMVSYSDAIFFYNTDYWAIWQKCTSAGRSHSASGRQIRRVSPSGSPSDPDTSPGAGSEPHQNDLTEQQALCHQYWGSNKENQGWRTQRWHSETQDWTPLKTDRIQKPITSSDLWLARSRQKIPHGRMIISNIQYRHYYVCFYKDRL